MARPLAYIPVSYAGAAAAPVAFDLSSISRPAAALDLLLLLTIALILPLGTHFADALLTRETPEFSFSPALIVTKVFDALLLLTFALYFLRRNRLPPSAFGAQLDRLGRQFLWGLLALAALYVALVPSIGLITLLVTLFPQLAPDLEHRTEFLNLLPLHSLASTVVLLVPVAIHEELLFRGLLIPYLHRLGLRWPGAVLLSTVVFALLHVTQGWLAIPQIFAVGLVLGAFLVWSRSLLAVMIAHFCFDLIQTEAARFLLPWIQRVSGGG